MLNRNTFDKNMSMLLMFKNIKANKQQNDFFYNLLKDEFTDEEFANTCVDICKTEELYNKYPDPKLFYDRKKEKQKTILIEEGAFYIDDTMPQYKAVIADLTQDTRDDICTKVWNWLVNNKRGELVNESFIIERLIQFRPYPLPEKLQYNKEVLLGK